MFIGIILIFCGMVLLAYGARILVRGSSRLAVLFRLSPFVIGLTVVAFGTSAPELFVSVTAHMQGFSQLVMGNLMGSNIINISLVVGLGAVLLPVPIGEKSTQIEWWAMFLSTLFVGVLLWNLSISRFEGLILFILMIIILISFIRRGWVQGDVVIESVDGKKPRSLGFSVGEVVLGVIFLYFGSELFIKGSMEVAMIMGIDERVVGLTIVAFGTGLPELATMVVATFKGRSDLAIGNLLGSNIFNLVGILGVCGILREIPAEASALHYDLPWLLVFSFALLICLISKKPIGRIKGSLFLILYAFYAISLYVI